MLRLSAGEIFLSGGESRGIAGSERLAITANGDPLVNLYMLCLKNNIMYYL